jgi:hypothetical protein
MGSAQAAGQPEAHAKCQSVDELLANEMARVARYRIAFVGSDSTLIFHALEEVIERIEVWFGPHPRIKRASKILVGTIHLREPFVDAVTGDTTIPFTRDDFDRSSFKPRAAKHSRSSQSATAADQSE